MLIAHFAYLEVLRNTQSQNILLWRWLGIYNGIFFFFFGNLLIGMTLKFSQVAHGCPCILGLTECLANTVYTYWEIHFLFWMKIRIKHLTWPMIKNKGSKPCPGTNWVCDLGQSLLCFLISVQWTPQLYKPRETHPGKTTASYLLGSSSPSSNCWWERVVSLYLCKEDLGPLFQ